MIESNRKKDLFVLVADEHIQRTMESLCRRHPELRTSIFEFDVDRHVGRDPGCRAHAVHYLRPFLDRYWRCLVVFDHDGCGSNDNREDLQMHLEEKLARSGWSDRAKVIVIKPELEAWIWGDLASLSELLGWADGKGLRRWLASRGLWHQDDAKPRDPKEAMRQANWNAPARRYRRISGRMFGKLAQSADLDNCRDPSFEELVATLQSWFPRERALS